MSPTNMLSSKVFLRSVVLFCLFVTYFGLIERTYANNPGWGMTTDGQLLAIKISDTIIEPIASGSSVFVGGSAIITPVVISSYAMTNTPVVIDHVEVHIDSLSPLTATLDGLGNWSVITQTNSSDFDQVEATLIASDGTHVTETRIMSCGCSTPPATEPAPPAPLDKFTFLPAISVE